MDFKNGKVSDLKEILKGSFAKPKFILQFLHGFTRDFIEHLGTNKIDRRYDYCHDRNKIHDLVFVKKITVIINDCKKLIGIHSNGYN